MVTSEVIIYISISLVDTPIGWPIHPHSNTLAATDQQAWISHFCSFFRHLSYLSHKRDRKTPCYTCYTSYISHLIYFTWSFRGGQTRHSGHPGHPGARLLPGWHRRSFRRVWIWSPGWWRSAPHRGSCALIYGGNDMKLCCVILYIYNCVCVYIYIHISGITWIWCTIMLYHSYINYSSQSGSKTC